MTVGIAEITKFFAERGLYEEGSADAQSAAMELLYLIRDRAASKGDTRNIQDEFKQYATEDIKTLLSQNHAPLINICMNILGDFNLSSVARNTNWWNARALWIVGRRKWDRRGAVGVQHYTDVVHFDHIRDAIAALRDEGYRIVAAEINDDAVPLTTYEWEDKTAIIYGEEGAGLPQEVLDAVDDVVFIPGRGSVRSLNVATTAGVFTYDYMTKRNYI